MKHGFYKIIILLVACIYVFSTIGVSVISHYCGGELEKVSLFIKSKSCCGGEENESAEEDGCCKNETVHVSFQKDFTFYTIIKALKAPVNQLFVVYAVSEFQTSNQLAFANISFFKNDHPPDLVQDQIVKNSVIRV